MLSYFTVMIDREELGYGRGGLGYDGVEGYDRRGVMIGILGRLYIGSNKCAGEIKVSKD